MQCTRRHLPHQYQLGIPLFVTFRLHGSLPAGRDFSDPMQTSGEAFVYMDRLLDAARSGPTYLRIPEIAQMVVETIRSEDGRDYIAHAWVIMPNHVHLLFTPQFNVTRTMQRLKGRTALEANRILNRAGAFWQRESYDHLVRDPEAFRRIERYVLMNPVRAGLTASPYAYTWSSAFGGLKPAAR